MSTPYVDREHAMLLFTKFMEEQGHWTEREGEKFKDVALDWWWRIYLKGWEDALEVEYWSGM